MLARAVALRVGLDACVCPDTLQGADAPSVLDAEVRQLHPTDLEYLSVGGLNAHSLSTPGQS